MRILLATMRYPTGAGESYLTTELADALVDSGHDAEVLHLDWDAASGGAVRETRGARGQRVVRCAPRWISGAGTLVRHATKFLLSGRHAARVARTAFELETFDAIVMWMPALAFGPLIRIAREAGIRNRLLVVWDFFPDHHREIGRITFPPAFVAARRQEQALLSHFTAIACTLPGNADYLRRNYRLGAGQKVIVTPIWCDTTPLTFPDRTEVRERHGLPPDAPVAVFGGQLSAGRGFEQILDAARIAERKGSPVQFLFVGDGEFAERIARSGQGGGNVHHRPAMPREAYLELIGACDAGMVATVPGVSSCTFPSKILDYLRAGLPVAASVEPGNELIALLAHHRIGGSVPFGDSRGYFRLVERLACDPALRAGARVNAPMCLAEVFDVSHAVSALTAAMR